MNFKVYTARKQGWRARDDKHVSIGKSRIGLGRVDLPYEYVVISYDKDVPAIQLTEGTFGDGFKVCNDKASDTRYLPAKSFTKLELIPYGIYERVKEMDGYVFRLRGEYISEV